MQMQMNPQMAGGMAGKTPVLVLNTDTKRDKGQMAQKNNILAAMAVSDIIRTTLGPRSMLKMILDPMGGIVMTNDGNAILREIDVTHPAAKSMIELARTQDENVGDGTTSVIILAGEVLHVARPFLEMNLHPTVIVGGFSRALNDALVYLKDITEDVDVQNDEQLKQVVQITLGTKFSSRFGDLVTNLALKAVKTVMSDDDQRTMIDIKRDVRCERIAGGKLEECEVLQGILINKDVTHGRMRRKILNSRIMLLDCGLEYKKGESQTNIEIMEENDFQKYIEIEEEFIRKICDDIIKLKPDVVITEKGCIDLAQHFLMNANISVIRRLRKMDNNRLAKATGAVIGHRPSEMTESHIGTKCTLFEISKIGDEYYSYFACDNPKACTVKLRGGSKELLQEIVRNMDDAMKVTKNIMLEPKLCPGGGATEMALSTALRKMAKKVEGVMQMPYNAVADAFEIIPRTLVQNAGGQAIRTMTKLRALHDDPKKFTYGIDGVTGNVVDMKTHGVWDPYVVKEATIKTAIESATLLLRIDDVVSGLRNKDNQ